MVKVKKGILGEMDALHHRMERMMENVLHKHGHSGSTSRDWCPAADLYETESEVVVVLEVAGIDAASLDVVLEDDLLRVTGRRPQPSIRKGCVALHHMEVEYGPFERLFSVPRDLEGDSAQARLDNGFLEIRLPKRQCDGDGRVEIKSE